MLYIHLGYIFQENYNYLRTPARKAIFGMTHNLKALGSLPSNIIFHMLDALIWPILSYGRNVSGVQTQGVTTIYKGFLWRIRCVLNVTSPTSIIIVVGEGGQILPTTSSHIKAMCHLNSVQILYQIWSSNKHVQNYRDCTTVVSGYTSFRLGIELWCRSKHESRSES